MTISVIENTDGTFTIDWDKEDPKESILNDWTEEDFIECIRSHCEEVIAKSDDPDNEQKASKVAKTPVKSTRKTKNTKSQELVYSSDLALFPYVDTFPYRLEDISEKKTCYFQCENHARKYITRYNPEYRLYCYTR